MALGPLPPPHMYFTEALQKLGLAQNEAKIYETLLKMGQSGVSKIAGSANINRRNVYDSIERLLEKGIVLAVVQGRDTEYEAVDPKKLQDIIFEQEQSLKSIMPQMVDLFKAEPRNHEVAVYKGLEGFKLYLRDVLRTGEDFYAIGGKGQMMSPLIADFSRSFIRDMNKKKLKMNVLFDYSVKLNVPDVLLMFKDESRVLPEEFSSNSTIDVFGDKVVITSWMLNHQVNDDVSFTVIKNQQLADSFRIWWKALWAISNPI